MGLVGSSMAEAKEGKKEAPSKEAKEGKKEAPNKKDAAMAKAKDLVANNPVVVFSKSYCPYCVSVKKLLSSVGAKYTAVELDEESDGAEIQSALAEWTRQRTVPSVFIAGKHIGGCDDTTAIHREGKLVPLLQEAGSVAKMSSK